MSELHILYSIRYHNILQKSIAITIIIVINVCIFVAITVKIVSGDKMYIDYKQIGLRIKQARKGNGFTQEYLAEQLSVSVGYVSQLERGVTKISLDTLAEIASILGFELTFFLDGVTVRQDTYLQQELQTIFTKLSPDRKRILLEIAEVLSH